MELSIIIPCEENRLDYLRSTLDKYITTGLEPQYEILIVSQTIKSFTHRNLRIRVIHYTLEDSFFNMSVPLNLGLRASKFNNIIVTSPEVIPITSVFKQLYKLERGNYICQVLDQKENKDIVRSLIHTGYRADNPGYCFFASYKKEDLMAIGGWDESFRNCQGYEDRDFGERLIKSGAEYKVLNDVILLHRWHERIENKEARERGRKVYEEHKEARDCPKN